MRKFFIFLLPVLLWACSDADNVYEYAEGTGAIVLRSDNVGGSVVTRSYDMTKLTVIVSGDDVEVTRSLPAEGVIRIDGLAAGDYTVTVTSHTDGMPDPDFGEAYYEGVESVTVVEGADKNVAVTCTLQNAGVFFYYDESLGGLYDDLVPTVTQGSDFLDYSGENKESIGYFLPEAVVITLKNGGDDVLINGVSSQSLELEAGKLWKVTLGVGAGGLTITVTVEEVTETQDEEWIISVPEVSGVSIAGYEGETITVTFTNGSTIDVVLNAGGAGSIVGVDGVIKSIAKAGGPEILIGRAMGDGIVLATDGADPVFRAAVDGFIPIGTYAEMQLINTDETSLAAKYILEADLDLMNEQWRPIGHGEGSDLYFDELENQFKGEFNGNNKTITNLLCEITHEITADEEAAAGLFGVVTGVIGDLNVTNAFVRASAQGATAGGIVGYMSGTSGVKVIGCSFRGSVVAEGGTYANNAGGIVGHMETGTIEECSVVLKDGDEIRVNGLSNVAGGIVSYINLGNVGGCSVEIAADARIEAAITDEYLGGSGDNVSYAGGIAGSTFGSVVISGCTTDIKGLVYAKHNVGKSYVGGIAAYSMADGIGDNTATISGEVKAENTSGAAAAGGILGMQVTGYGASNCETFVTPSGKITATSQTTGSNAVYVGGTTGSCNVAMSWNYVEMAGTMTARTGTAAYVGGISGSLLGATASSSATIGGSTFIMPSTGRINVSGGTAMHLIGGIIGNGSRTQVRACYSIIDGIITSTESPATVAMGGITGALGAATGTVYSSTVASYSVIGGTFVNPTISGAITGQKPARGSLVDTHWWSDSVAQGNGVNADDANAIKMANRDRASFEEAAASMNQTLEDYGLDIRYWYDTETGRLMISQI